ncbi:MAG: TauD/TfdA family dioxygenase [Comamonadaceae bacterium]|nr:TauD/TfdA family dioxygenase [Comamonadaceae bacterium]
MADQGTRTAYIPYTTRPIKWHTDGYYNPPERQVRGMVLHCVRPAASGGENALMDHEIAYILLRDEDPGHIRALMAPDAMTIPAREEEGEVARGDQPGPVFSVDGVGLPAHALHRPHPQHRLEGRRRDARGGEGAGGDPRLRFALHLPRPAGTGHGAGVQQRAARPRRLHRNAATQAPLLPRPLLRAGQRRLIRGRTVVGRAVPADS